MACILLADLLASSRGGYACPLEATCDELAEAAEAHGLCMAVYRFSELLPGQGLREHAVMAMDPPGSSQSTVGPWMEVWSFGFAVDLLNTGIWDGLVNTGQGSGHYWAIDGNHKYLEHLSAHIVAAHGLGFLGLVRVIYCRYFILQYSTVSQKRRHGSYFLLPQKRTGLAPVSELSLDGDI